MKWRHAKVGVFLLAGAVINVAVAWWALAAAVAISPTGGGRFLSAEGSVWPDGTPDWPAPESLYKLRRRTVAVVVQSTEIAGWTWTATESRCGWPWLSLRCVRWEAPSESDAAQSSLWRSGIPTSSSQPTVQSPPPITGFSSGPVRPSSRTPTPSTVLCLPVQPVLPGFAGNTLVFAALAAVVSRIPRWLIRRFRRRCGLCLDCGHPVGATPVCTECGARVRASPIRPARPARRPFAAWGVLLAVVIVSHAVSFWWGFCLKTQSGWYGGVWATRIWIGYSREPFMAPGVEVGHFAIPIGLDFQYQTDGVRSITGVPLWWMLLPLLLVLAWVWWRYAVYQTIRSKHGTAAPVIALPKASEGSADAAL